MKKHPCRALNGLSRCHQYEHGYKENKAEQGRDNGPGMDSGVVASSFFKPGFYPCSFLGGSRKKTCVDVAFYRDFAGDQEYQQIQCDDDNSGPLPIRQGCIHNLKAERTGFSFAE